MEELICPQCCNIFNEFENIPLMLPDCGHTICQKCIKQMLMSADGQQICCPEDNILAKGKTHITEFPKNCQLLKMVVKQRPSIDHPEYQLHLNNLAQEKIELCGEHLEKLEIVCLTDKIRICTKCALFGNHRHHEVRSVDDVVREIASKAENIMQTYQKILDKQSELTESKFYESMNEKYQIMLQESQMAVKEKFKELHHQLDLKENKLLEQLNGLTQTLEQQTKRQIRDQVQQSLQQAELWKIGAKDRLLYFSTKTESGELPLDLLYNQEFKGNAILDEMDRTIKMLEQRINNVKIKKIRVDFKKQEIEKCFESMCSLTLQMSHNETNQRSLFFQEIILQLIGQTTKTNLISQVTHVVSNSQHELKQTTQSQVQQAKSPVRTEPSLHSFQSATTPLKQLKQKSPSKDAPNNVSLQPPPPVSLLRQGISPTPKLQEKRKKTFKINEKFEPIMQAFRNDNLEIVDLSNAELGDEGCNIIAEQLKMCKKVKQLKLARNKISDEGASVVLQALTQNPNITSLHLSSNMISERILDVILNITKSGQLPKNIYLSQTLINATKAKKRIEELKKLGYVVNI
ncbi:unnamed protein product (macronuclear) [Paramecium tetraurelia]|uniref:RING-type domain-containing protein n=1 Tax=Paramecium tetraurelia TaxID=5888 RepID=A0BQY3_PARTE|nr:uncharacterized protein GSPATT00031179001 [Paramecium tetraurelia]CAK60950.1 unnamed protein product [Paramecium tetraurelia]|eukprot:XP_001428348.1 hypothetical protein (macronuclear) [Paramecium tetraurelia strain d4-2]